MKRLISIIITFCVLCMNLNMVFAEDTSEPDFFNYVETHKIETSKEFVMALIRCENNSAVRVSPSLTYVSEQNKEVAFEIELDYENREIITESIIETNTSTYNTSGTVNRDVYSHDGTLLYKLSVTGTFIRTAYTCTTSTVSGSFVKGAASLWNSSPSLSKGSISAGQSYARISGTASMGTQRRNYNLTLICNTSGALTSTYSEQ